MPIHRQSYTNPCQSSANLIPIHTNPPAILYQSIANPISIQCQSGSNPTKSIQGCPPHTTRGPIHRQSNPFNVNLPVLNQSINPTSMLYQSANPSPICQSRNPGQICKPITNLPIHHLYPIDADPWQITQFNANPTHHQSTETIPDQPTNLSTIHGHSASASPIIHPTAQTDDTRIIPNGIRSAMVEPIRVTKPHSVKGTGTIRSQLLSGRHPICQSNFNPVSIVCQSEGDNCPNNRGTSLL